MPPKKKSVKNPDNMKYNSPIAQMIQAGGHFINGVSNPMFIIALLGLGVICFISYKGIPVLANLSSNVGNLSVAVIEMKNESKSQNAQQIELFNKQNDKLDKIYDELTAYHYKIINKK